MVEVEINIGIGNLLAGILIENLRFKRGFDGVLQLVLVGNILNRNRLVCGDIGGRTAINDLDVELTAFEFAVLRITVVGDANFFVILSAELMCQRSLRIIGNILPCSK